MLAHSGDWGAGAVAQAVSRRLAPGLVTVVRPIELASGARWSHRVHSDGSVTGTLLLASGVSLTADAIGSVLNRMTAAISPAFACSPPRDRDYAAAELQALTVSWLHGLRCSVVNPATAGDGGCHLTQRQWLGCAARLGIPVATGQSANGEGRQLRRVLVAGDRTYGDVDDGLRRACAELAGAAACTLLECTFEIAHRGAVLVGVSPAPPLADPEAIDAVCDLLIRSRATPGGVT